MVPVQTRTYTKITVQKSILTEAQHHSVEDVKKALAALQKKQQQSDAATAKAQPAPIKGSLQILLERLELVVKINRVQTVEYEFANNVVVGKYTVTIVGDIGPIELLVKVEFEADPTKNLKEGNTALLTNLRLVLVDSKPHLLTTRETVFFVTKKGYSYNQTEKIEDYVL